MDSKFYRIMPLCFIIMYYFSIIVWLVFEVEFCEFICEDVSYLGYESLPPHSNYTPFELVISGYQFQIFS
jgi:hypothetical protein